MTLIPCRDQAASVFEHLCLGRAPYSRLLLGRCIARRAFILRDMLQRWPVSKRVNSSKAPADDPTLIDWIGLGPELIANG